MKTLLNPQMSEAAQHYFDRDSYEEVADYLKIPVSRLQMIVKRQRNATAKEIDAIQKFVKFVHSKIDKDLKYAEQ